MPTPGFIRLSLGRWRPTSGGALGIYSFVQLGSLVQLERAIQDCDEAIRLNPNLAIAYANRASDYTLLSRDDEAQQDVDRAVGLGFDRDTLARTIKELKSQR